MSIISPFSQAQAVLVDENDKILGFKEKFATHHHPVPLHRAISIVLYDATGKLMLLQKRSSHKKTWPMKWTNTVCADVLPTETYLDTAKRRLKEEMGIKTKLKEKFSFIYKFDYDKIWGEHELDHVFTGKYEGPIHPNPKEAAGFEWIEISELKSDMKKNPDKYTPWFHIIMGKLK